MTKGLGAVASALGTALPMSSTAVIGHSADPKFDTWDGNAYTLQRWIRTATESVTLRGTSDAAAIQHARLKLGEHLTDEYPKHKLDQPQAWQQFVRWLQYKFLPTKWDIQSRLHVLKGNVHMRGSNFRQYVNEF